MNRYTSPDVMALEGARLWPRTWVLAGPLCDLASPGDHFVVELGAESILVARDGEGRVAAHHNACRHRGMPLRPCGPGRAERFTCPYHGWEWGLDGRLLHAPDGAGFRGGIPATHRRLAPVAVAEWAGFAWVHLDPPRQTLAEYLGPVVAQVAVYRPDDFDLVEHASVEWPCNWKLAVEAFSETYHLTQTHPHLLEIVDPKESRFDDFGLHNLLLLGLAVVDERHARERPGELTRSLLARHGIDPDGVAGAPEARARLQRAVRERGLRHGVTYEGLTEAQLTDTHQYFLFPNTHLDFHGADDFSVFRYRPHPTDPGRCFFDLFDYARRLDPVAPSAPPPSRRTVTPLLQLPLTIQQDADILEQLQPNMRSRASTLPLLHALEWRLARMHESIDRYLAEP